MTRPIGYYVHHQGEGHLDRARAVARHAPGRFVLLGTGLEGRCDGLAHLDLPDDRGGMHETGGGDRPCALHYAPEGHDGLRRRVAALTGWIADAQPALMVVDVSVEVAMLARLASTPTIYVRLHGHRDDPAHREAFRAGRALLAPFHPDLEDEETPDPVVRKTFYAPGLTTPPPSSGPIDEALVLGVVGRGGKSGDGRRWAEAARATPGLRWQVIGPCDVTSDAPTNLAVLGWVEDAAERIARAGVVVGGAGDGLVGAVIAAGRPFVCLPEPRPYQEQARKAARLAALGAAVVPPGWPEAGDWPGVLAQARALDPHALSRLGAPDGAAQAARWLLDLAEDGTT